VKDLTKKKLGQFSKSLASAQDAFRGEVELLADQARDEILPYFREHGLDYRAGNGSWLITRPSADEAEHYRPEDQVGDEELPENIRALLLLEVGRGDCLGFYIGDIHRIRS
jgi:hypothetical protein